MQAQLILRAAGQIAAPGTALRQRSSSGRNVHESRSGRRPVFLRHRSPSRKIHRSSPPPKPHAVPRKSNSTPSRKKINRPLSPKPARVWSMWSKSLTRPSIKSAARLCALASTASGSGADRPDSYLSFSVDPGEHHLCTRWQSHLKQFSDKAAFASLTADPGKIYYFRARIIEGGSDVRARLRSRQRGRRQISGCLVRPQRLPPQEITARQTVTRRIPDTRVSGILVC